jgi:regulator of sigma E protease
MVLTIIVFVIILGILVFVHELGHFIVARRNGIKAEEFGFGFPPRIVGIQFMTGKGKQKVSEVESIEVKTMDMKIGGEEIIQETITEKIHTSEKMMPIKKWRIIWGSTDGDSEDEKQNRHEIYQKKFSGGTIYSLNWLPIGGFVRIKGEDGGEKKDADSFASKSPWIRFKVLAAGVTMNFILAWVLFSVLLVLGTNQEVDLNDSSVQGTKIQIAMVVPKTPAYEMGIREGDTIVKCIGSDERCDNSFANVSEMQAFVNDNKGKQITLEVQRGDKTLDFTGTPRLDVPANEGALGVELVQTKFVKYSLWEAIIKAPVVMFNMLVAIMYVLRELFVGNTSDIGGPIAIVHMTKQVTELGFSYVIQLIAVLSINLAIINILPFPALDGGRILFILIEKIKGSPVSQKIENWAHTAGFFLLMLLMIYLVIHDFMRYGFKNII